MSADGSTISVRADTKSDDRGFIRPLSGGTELALDYFTRNGLDLSGWRITVTAGMSTDGKTFTGTGVHDGVAASSFSSNSSSDDEREGRPVLPSSRPRTPSTRSSAPP